MPAVSLDWVLNQLAGMQFPKQGEAYDFIKKCARKALPRVRKERSPQEGTPTMEFLLGEIAVDGPEHRAEAVAVNDQMGRKLEWPEGWWAVSDDQFAYLAFFQFEEDAWAFRLYLINQRQNGRACAKRYQRQDVLNAEEEARQEARRAETRPPAT